KLEHGGRLQFGVVWSADIGPSSANQVLGDGPQGFCFVRWIFYLASRSEGNDGAIVHRVMEGGARQNDSVDESHGEAHGGSALKLTQHPAGRRAVQIESAVVWLSPVKGGNDKWLSVYVEADMR